MKKTPKKTAAEKEICLVTGAAGFIGSHVADELLKKGYKVIAVDDLSGGNIKNVNPKATFLEGSITDTAFVNDIFKKYKIAYVFHLAAYAAEGLSHFIRKFNYDNNLIGSLNLINASVNRNVKSFVFTSSMAVYGHAPAPFTEDMTPTPADPYGIAKYAVEMDLKAAHDLFGLNYIIFRPHNVYGERQNLSDKYRNVIGIFINQTLSGKPVTIYGEGLQTRAFTYISEVAPVIASSIELEQFDRQIVNIGGDTPYTILEMIDALRKVTAKKIDVVHLDARNEVKAAYSKHDKLRKLTKLPPKVSLDEGLDIMYRWARNEIIEEEKKFKNIEVAKNLPKSWQ
jgi:UDP-glucose 4-epimerase